MLTANASDSKAGWSLPVSVKIVAVDVFRERGILPVFYLEKVSAGNSLELERQ